MIYNWQEVKIKYVRICKRCNQRFTTEKKHRVYCDICPQGQRRKEKNGKPR